MLKLKKLAVGTLAVAALAATLSVAAPSAPAFAKTCKPLVTSGVGRATLLSTAKKRARIKWRAKVRLTPGLGWSFSDWGKADKTTRNPYSCGKFGKIYKKWGCRALARPCK